MTNSSQRPWKELQFFLDRDGIPQKQLATMAGLSPGYINDLLRGRYAPGGRARKLIAKALRIPSFMLLPPPLGHETADDDWKEWATWSIWRDDDDNCGEEAASDDSGSVESAEVIRRTVREEIEKAFAGVGLITDAGATGDAA